MVVLNNNLRNNIIPLKNSNCSYISPAIYALFLLRFSIISLTISLLR